LFTDLSAKCFQSFTESEDDERRVFYVGVTRAKRQLHVVEPQTSKAFPL
jgi:superfamily I DNA/RNA helicase